MISKKTRTRSLSLESLFVRRLVREVVKIGGSREDVFADLAKNGRNHFPSLAKKVLESKRFIFRCLPIIEQDKSDDGWTEKWHSTISEKVECVFVPKLLRLPVDCQFDTLGDILDHFEGSNGMKFANQQHLEALLKEQERIPAEWNKFILVAIDTIWTDESGHARVPCLIHKKKWSLVFHGFSHDFDRRYKIVGLGKFR